MILTAHLPILPKKVRHVLNCSPPSTAKVKNANSYSTHPPLMLHKDSFTLMLHKDSFTFTVTLQVRRYKSYTLQAFNPHCHTIMLW
jgi:hypothetical protein